jgi:hypothetical protein
LGFVLLALACSSNGSSLLETPDAPSPIDGTTDRGALDDITAPSDVADVLAPADAPLVDAR